VIHAVHSGVHFHANSWIRFARDPRLGLRNGGGAPAGAEPLSPWGGMVYGGTNQGHGDLSVEDGYSTIGGLLGRQLNSDDLNRGFAFVDIRGHLVDDGTHGFNTHIGYRWLGMGDGTPDANQWVYVINAGYDGREFVNDHKPMGTMLGGGPIPGFDDEEEINWFYWCRVGAEALGNKWELRTNGYIDCGDHQSIALEAVSFRKNTLLIEILQQRALWGVDAKIGRRFQLSDTIDLTGSLTGYHFASSDFDPATGGQLSLDVAFGDRLELGGRASWDTLFGTNGLVSLKLRFGTTPSTNRSEQNVRERLMRPVERQELVVVDEQLTKRQALTFKGTDIVVPFFHIDNTSNAGGKGTFEDRFRSVEEAVEHTRPGDVIIVHKGDGTTKFYDTGFELKDRQTVLGAGFSGGVVFGGKTVWYLPGKIRSRGRKIKLQGKPTLTNPDGNVVTLANDNTVGFLRVVDAGENGIFGEDIRNAKLYDNWVFDSQGSGIFIDGFSGTADIRGNGVFRNLGSANPGGDGGGIHILDASGRVLIRENTCGDFEHGGNGSGGFNDTDCIEVSSKTAGDLFLLAKSNSIRNNNGDGIELHQLGTGAFTAVIEDNVITHNTETAFGGAQDIPFAGATGPVNITIRNNVMSHNGFSAIDLAHFTGPGPLTALIEGNTIQGNGYNAFMVPGFDGFSAGIFLDLRTNISDVTVRNNLITDSVGPGIGVDVFAAFDHLPGGPPDSVARLLIENNTIRRNGFGRTDDYLGGIVMRVNSLHFPPGPTGDNFIARLDATIRNNVFSANNRHAVSGYTARFPGALQPAGILCMNLQGNTGGGNYLLNESGGYTIGSISLGGGGTFLLDPASGGNTGTITTVGTIGSATCETP